MQRAAAAPNSLPGVPGLITAAFAANAVFALVELTLGEGILRLCAAAIGARPQEPSLERLGTALLAGAGACSLLGIPLAAAHLFRWQAFAACGLITVLLGRRVIMSYARRFPPFLRHAREASVTTLVCLGVALVVGVAGWLAALAPPVVDDELTAHLPEARTLADSHVLHLTLSNHLQPPSNFVYGNLPKLLETLYGEALTIDGVPLMHTLHFTLLTSLAILVAGVSRQLWGSRAAVLAVAGIALYSDLVANAVTGLVDAGATAFEVGAVLLLALWAVKRDPDVLAGSFLLLGFALATKYTALPTAAFAVIVAGTILVRQRRWRELAAVAGIAAAACGYWYGKNLVRFGNPVFPFYFGHPGLTDDEYRRTISAVQYFVSGPRKFSTFLAVPGRFATFPNATAAVAFVLAPLALAARGPRRAAALLLIYAVTYTTYWFWLGSHENRFLMSAIVVAIVLAAAAVGAARGIWGFTASVAVAVVFVVGARVHLQDFRGSPHEALSAWLSTDKAGFALGLVRPTTYLRHYFGCQVDAVRELERRRIFGTVGIFEREPPPDFPRNNTLVRLELTAATPAGVRAQLSRDGIHYILSPGRSPLGLSSDRAARPVLASAKPFWHGGGCWLFRIA
jgi:hypothetical protein